jgi:hypothetical protein
MFAGYDWPKIAANTVHGLLLLASAYASVSPKWAWAIPAFQAWGQMMGAPSLKVTPKTGASVVLALALAGALLSGCVSGQAAEIVRMENARGCVYFRGSAAPWASLNALVVGTFGTDPPAYVECWRGIPPGL